MVESISSFKLAIRQAIAYADIFDYPLSVHEIHRYLPGITANYESVEAVLEQDKDFVINTQGFYTLPGRESLSAIRIRRDKIASQLWLPALKYGKMISSLPFVRMVAVTGALAMNNVDVGADIDYLIVTEPDHLWLTRALVLLLGRFSSSRGYTLCPNYLISLRAMVFPDKNLYAAHELVQMIPVAGLDVYDEIIKVNSWITTYLPNSVGLPPLPNQIRPPIPHNLSITLLEKLLENPFVDWLEKWEMERKIRKLSNEQRLSAESTFTADVCKGHIHRHQLHINQELEERYNLLVNK